MDYSSTHLFRNCCLFIEFLEGLFMFKKLNPKDRHTKCSRCNYVGCNPQEFLGHWIWVLRFYTRKYDPVKVYKRFVNWLTSLDYSQIADVEVDGINTKDYPDFVDAFIASATYKGKLMNEKQLERINQDSQYVYDHVMKKLF